MQAGGLLDVLQPTSSGNDSSHDGRAPVSGLSAKSMSMAQPYEASKDRYLAAYSNAAGPAAESPKSGTEPDS